MRITPLLDTLRLEKISDAEYFSQKYSNYISNSRLSLINPDQDGSFEKFMERKFDGFSSSLVLGSAVHCMCLQNDLFDISVIESKPTAKAGAMADYIINKVTNLSDITDSLIIEASDKIDYYKGSMDSVRIATLKSKCNNYWQDRLNEQSSEKELLYLDSKTKQKAIACIDAVNNNKSIQKLLHPQGLIETPISENEQAILLDIECDIDGNIIVLRFKAKLDNYTIDFENNVITVNDIKTVGDILPNFQNNQQRFHYNREIAVYSWLLSLCAEKFYNMKNPIVKGNYLVVSTIPQYYTKVFPLSYKDFQEGWDEFVTLIKLVAQEFYNHDIR